MGAYPTAPKKFNWFYDNSSLAMCAPYWCPGNRSLTTKNRFISISLYIIISGEPNNSYGNATYIGDGKNI